MLLYRDDENVEKVKELERAAVNLSPEDISAAYAELGEVKFSARALGFACRFRGVDCVRALVEGGASFGTPIKHNEELLYHAYSKSKYDFDHSNYSVYLLNITEKLAGSCCSKSMRFSSSVKVGKIRLSMLPDSERARVLKYLCDNREKCSFEPSELLFYSIFARDDFITGELKKLKIGLSENRIKAIIGGGKDVDCYWREYKAMTEKLAFEDFTAITERLFGELGGKKIRCNDRLFAMIKGSLKDPKFAELFFDKFNTAELNKARRLREIIYENNTELLPLVEKAGWLSNIKRRDSMIEYATELGRTECTAWLLDFKNRTADLAAEREKAEKKMRRELNAAPDSVTALKALWSYEKLEDGTLKIKRYKGDRTEITVPKKIGKSIVTVIGKFAFSPHYPRLDHKRKKFLKAIKKVTLPDTITRIEHGAFSYCTGIEDINIPDSVTEIGNEVFLSCENLSRVKLPNRLSEIPAYLFLGCKSLREITVPDGVIKIERGAFSNCKVLEYVRLPSGLSEIPYRLFYWCENLKTVTIPDSVKRIAMHAFKGCGELTEIVIPNGVTAIDQQVFANCKKLKTVVLPSSIQQILSEKGKFFYGSPNAVAVVEPDSYAENYCKQNDVPYKYRAIRESEHNF